MTYKILHDIRASIDKPVEEILSETKKRLHLSEKTNAFIYRRSLDTRKDRFSFVYSVALETELSAPGLKEFPSYRYPEVCGNRRVIPIIGCGPAGMFCAFVLAKCGFHPLIIERGAPMEARISAVEQFWKGGELNPETNVQFGEGGAGTFSDGKLTTRINDPRCRTVLETFVQFGAPEEILWLAKPHIGTDRLRHVVRAMREEIVSLGGEIRFYTKCTDLCFHDGALTAIELNGERYPTDLAVLAVGNGAFDTYRMLLASPLFLEPKPFSVGFRAEHRQDALNRMIYGSYYGNPALPPAEYTFSYVTDKARSEAVYSFCMCPGGSVVNASSLPGRLTTNGMSEYSRNGENANAAILASVRPATVEEGLMLQAQIEQSAYAVAGGAAPASTGKAFLEQEVPVLQSFISATFCPGVVGSDLNCLFPDAISARLRAGFALFQKRILRDEPSLLTAPETRTSAPLRIVRDPESLQSVSGQGLYPCGEGAGYSGGIMSSAVDGIRVAEKIIGAMT